jgi:hypothetical protein
VSNKASGGNKKSSKADQPKRRRYNVESRGHKRRLRDLERHIERNPNDKTAPEALPKVRALVGGGKGK